MSKIKSYIMTFQAIAALRAELRAVSETGDTRLINETLSRLSNLYASIDADNFVSELSQLDNVVYPDFKNHRAA